MAAVPEPRLYDVLSEGIVLPSFRCAGIEESLDRLLAPLLLRVGLKESAVWEALQAVKSREKAGSTCVGEVALPHARIPGLTQIVAGIGLNRGGVYLDDPSVHVLVAFASPAQATALHLKFLARVAHLLRDDEARRELLAAETPAAVLDVLRARDKR